MLCTTGSEVILLDKAKNNLHLPFPIVYQCKRCGNHNDDGAPSMCFDCMDFLEQNVSDQSLLKTIYQYYEKKKVFDKAKALDYERIMGWVKA